jgi:hypothetical protein
MADFKISNLTIRIEDSSLPRGLILSQNKSLGGRPPVADGGDGGGGGCGCSCTCSCTCTCTSTSSVSRDQFEAVELAVLRESLKDALQQVEEAERTVAPK